MNKVMLFATISVALGFSGCMDSNPSNYNYSAEKIKNINNSDSRKTNYQDPSSNASTLEIMEKSVAAKLAKNVSHRTPKATLSKSSTTTYVGFLVGSNTMFLNATIYMDDEDNGNASQLYYTTFSGSGSPSWSAAWGDSAVPMYGFRQPAGTDSKFQIQRVGVTSLPAASIDYAVFKMDESCPSGTYPFTRYFDNEDNNNANSYTGSITPSYVENSGTPSDGRASLEFCFIPKNESSTTIVWLGSNLAVFAPVGPTPVGPSYSGGSDIGVFCQVWAWMITDDEDTNNGNSWNFYGMSQTYIDRINTFMNGTTNTHLTANHCMIPVGI